MPNLEIASAMSNCNVVDLACKTNARVDLNEDEKAVASQFDEWARDIGSSGRDKDLQIAQFINKTINETFDNYPSELLNLMFDRGSIGETDSVEYFTEPKNTMKAIQSAPGGSVERSYLDISKCVPVVKNFQTEFDLSFADLRNSGWKNVALFTQFTVDSLNNQLFADVFGAINSAITSGNNYVDGTASATVTQALIDAVSLYVHDWAENGGCIVSLSKYIQQISKLSGYSGYMADAWKDSLYRTGLIPSYDGIPLFKVASNRTLNGDGVTKLLTDKTVFGIAGKIGALDMIGDVHTYEEEDINKEQLHVKVADFRYARTFYNSALDKVVKLTLQ